MIAILFYVVSTDLKKVVGTARIMLDISIVSYHVEYIICFSFTVYVGLFLVLSRDIKIHNISCKNLLLKTNDYTLITNNQAVATSKKSK